MGSLLKSTATLRIETAIELVRVGEALRDGWFRGQGSTEWPLQSTLERDAERFGVPKGNRLEREEAMFKLFKERAHLYDHNFIEPQSTFEWYSLIRHYGGPSRLFDITSSYLVATYFALSDSPPNKDAVVWAFRNLDDYSKKCEVVDAMFEPNNGMQKVIITKPARINDRINAQSGGFFVPSSVEKSLEELITDTYGTNLNEEVERTICDVEQQPLKHHQIWKLVIPHDKHAELLRFLSRCNIRPYSLFPGMEGLAASLREMIRAFQ